MSNTESGLIFMRLFVEVSSECEAREVALKLIDVLRPYGETSIFKIQPYWKIPEQFEVTVEIQDILISGDTVIEVCKTLGTGWVEAGSSMILRSEVGHFTRSNKIRWASVEFIEKQ